MGALFRLIDFDFGHSYLVRGTCGHPEEVILLFVVAQQPYIFRAYSFVVQEVL